MGGDLLAFSARTHTRTHTHTHKVRDKQGTAKAGLSVVDLVRCRAEQKQKHNNRLHWTGSAVEACAGAFCWTKLSMTSTTTDCIGKEWSRPLCTIMHNYAQLCNLAQLSIMQNYAQLCTCIIFPPLPSVCHSWEWPGHGTLAPHPTGRNSRAPAAYCMARAHAHTHTPRRTAAHVRRLLALTPSYCIGFWQGLPRMHVPHQPPCQLHEAGSVWNRAQWNLKGKGICAVPGPEDVPEPRQGSMQNTWAFQLGIN
jgi:hypothetical protein